MSIIPRDDRDRGLDKNFLEPDRRIAPEEAENIVRNALRKYEHSEESEAERVRDESQLLFPDDEKPTEFWDSAASRGFRDFFVWGHDHDFGCGITRSGAMGPRHIEIVSELLSLGMMSPDLSGRDVLNVGCWTGGDLLILNGLGGNTTSMEEHRTAAEACEFLFQRLDVSNRMLKHSVYADDEKLSDSFDLVYCCGVIYHVTDPLLLLRILFCYLRVGGRIVLETKSSSGQDSTLSYSGTVEKGWNWYAPNEEVFFRWLVDAGFDSSEVYVYRRTNGRLLASATKTEKRRLPENSGFSRPGSWLESLN